MEKECRRFDLFFNILSKWQMINAEMMSAVHIIRFIRASCMYACVFYIFTHFIYSFLKVSRMQSRTNKS